jgi:hypothetical protein
MGNKMKKIIKSIKNLTFAMCLTLASTCVLAEESIQEEAKSSQITLVEAQKDLANRFILSVFGKDALTWFEVREIKDVNILDGMKKADIVAQYTMPFPYLYKEIQFLFVLLMLFSTTLFVFYALYILYSGLMKTQTSGEFMGQSWSSLFLIIKFMISIGLVMPFMGSVTESATIKSISETVVSESSTSNTYSLSQALVFKVAGYSNLMGKHVNNALIDYQPRTFPSLVIPQNDTKFFEVKAIVDFMICVKTDSSVKGELNLYMLKENDKITGQISSGDCKITVDFGLDSKGVLQSQNPVVKSVVGDYQATQLKIIKKTLTRLFKKADKVANVLLLPHSKVDEESSKPSDSKFVEHTKYAANIDNLNLWENNCETILDMDLIGELKEIDRKHYSYLAYRCLALEVNRMVLIPNEANILNYLKVNNYLKGNHVELCSHDYGSLDSRPAKTKIGDPSKEIEKLKTEMNVSINHKFKTIESCLQESCSNLNTEYSNLYMCASAISLYDSVSEDEHLKERGFFALGSNIFKQFSKFNNKSAQNVYNKFKVVTKASSSTFSKDDSKSLIIPILYTKKEINDRSIINKVSDYDYDSLSSDFTALPEKDFIDNAYNFIDDDLEMDFFGARRMVTCIKSPLQIKDGISCGSVPEEYHNFGKNLIDFYVQTKLLITVASAFKVRLNKRKSLSGLKDASGNMGKLKKFRNLASIILPALNSFSLDTGGLTSYLTGTVTEVNDFGSLNSKKIGMMSYNEEMIAVVYTLLSYTGEQGQGLASLIDKGLSGILFIGILFAFIIPLLPYYFYLTLLFSWMLLLFQSIMIAPLWAVYLLKQSNNHSSDIMKRGFSLFLTLFLKIPFLATGTILAWILTNTVMSRVMALFNFDEITNLSYGESLLGFVNSLIKLGVYGVLIYVITNITINVMTTFYDFATKWIAEGLGNVSQGKDENSSTFAQTKNSIKPFVKG